MFTVEQIQKAHSKVKSGADFPTYIQEIMHLGVINYEAYVAEGHINYYGANNHKVIVVPKYERMSITEKADV